MASAPRTNGSAPEVLTACTGQQGVVAALPVKRPRGRPKGSKNKPKTDGGSSAKKPRKSKAKLKMEDVNSLLKQHGVFFPDSVSQCLRAAILQGHVKLLKPEEDPGSQFGLDQLLLESQCIMCNDMIRVTVRDILYQRDCAGLDYEDGGERASVQCENEDCGGIYVTDICCGNPHFDSGKFHNHCIVCPDFGTCIGDYREAHCFRCGQHFFAGLMGDINCYNCS